MMYAYYTMTVIVLVLVIALIFFGADILAAIKYSKRPAPSVEHWTATGGVGLIHVLRCDCKDRDKPNKEPKP